MDATGEFARWLRQWFSQEEVEAILGSPWPVREGAKLRGNVIMGIEEFLQLAASFAVERTLNVKVECVVDLDKVYAFHMPTRTLVVAARFGRDAVEPRGLEAFLAELEAEARASASLMALRAVAL